MWRPGEGVISPGTGAMDSCEPSYGCWKTKPGSCARASALSKLLVISPAHKVVYQAHSSADSRAWIQRQLGSDEGLMAYRTAEAGMCSREKQIKTMASVLSEGISPKDLRTSQVTPLKCSKPPPNTTQIGTHLLAIILKPLKNKIKLYPNNI